MSYKEFEMCKKAIIESFKKILPEKAEFELTGINGVL